MSEKTLKNTTASKAKDNVSDIQFWGYGDIWKLISKTWSEKEGWMKSTKAMQMDTGCLVQVSTQQGEHVAEAVTFIPGIVIYESKNEGGEVVGRYLGVLKTEN